MGLANDLMGSAQEKELLIWLDVSGIYDNNNNWISDIVRCSNNCPWCNLQCIRGWFASWLDELGNGRAHGHRVWIIDESLYGMPGVPLIFSLGYHTPSTNYINPHTNIFPSYTTCSIKEHGRTSQITPFINGTEHRCWSWITMFGEESKYLHIMTIQFSFMYILMCSYHVWCIYTHRLYNFIFYILSHTTLDHRLQLWPVCTFI